jgi:hypothetical protein
LDIDSVVFRKGDDIASAPTAWNNKDVKAPTQQKNKQLSLKMKLLYFGNEKHEPTDNDLILLNWHVNSSILEIKHGPPRRKATRIDTINLDEDVKSLEVSYLPIDSLRSTYDL